MSRFLKYPLSTASRSNARRSSMRNLKVDYHPMYFNNQRRNCDAGFDRSDNLGYLICIRRIYTDSVRSYDRSASAQRCLADRGQDRSLIRLRELLLQLERTNSRLEKENILRAFVDLKHLLMFILDPHVRLHVRSTKVLAAIEKDVLDVTEKSFEQPKSLLQIFRSLHDRSVTGNDALYFIISHLHRLRVLPVNKGTSPSRSIDLLDVFLRCLDRDLKVGVSYKTLLAAYSEKSEVSVQKSYDRLVAENVALGRQIFDEELGELLQSTQRDPQGSSWLISRKLDGVRCVVRVDFVEASQASESGSNAWQVVDIRTYSRTGRAFETLQLLEDEIRQNLSGNPDLARLFQCARQSNLTLHPDNGNGKARIYLDGEMCTMKRDVRSSSKSDECEAAFTEDFQGVAGSIRKKNYTLLGANFFPFDMLLSAELSNWQDRAQNCQVLSDRLKRLDYIFARSGGNCSELQVLKKLRQEPIGSIQQIYQWQERATKLGWEGLILRKDVAFEGKRSASIRKLKQSKESEYVVVDVEISSMRLSIGQVYAQRRALASAIIEHNGHRVSIGSGFSTEQRLRYAENPDLLIGKEITVAYFGESRSRLRSDDVTSLRFPRVKAVWEKGKRDM